MDAVGAGLRWARRARVMQRGLYSQVRARSLTAFECSGAFIRKSGLQRRRLQCYTLARGWAGVGRQRGERSGNRRQPQPAGTLSPLGVHRMVVRAADHHQQVCTDFRPHHLRVTIHSLLEVLLSPVIARVALSAVRPRALFRVERSVLFDSDVHARRSQYQLHRRCRLSCTRKDHPGARLHRPLLGVRSKCWRP